MMKDFIINGREELWKILKEIKSKNIAEVGVASGDNLISLCQCEPEIAVAVDTWDDYSGTNKHCSVVRLALTNRIIVPVRIKSEIAATYFDDGYFDCVYIDANHRYEYVINDLKKWWPKVSETGIMAGHDYNLFEWQNEPMGVKQAVDEFAEMIHADVYIIKDDPYDSWAICKGPYRIINAEISNMA